MSSDQNKTAESTRGLALKHWSGLFIERVATIPEDIMLMTEMDLEKHFTPSNVDFFLRKNFWKKSKEAQDSGTLQLSTNDLYEGICTKQHFYHRFLKDPHRLAWLMVPIQSHVEIIEEAFYFSLKKVRDEILSLPVNEKTGPLIMKALQFFADRHLGPMLQKVDINQKTLQMNVDATATMKEAMSSDRLNDKFTELQSKMKDVKQIEAKVDEENNDQG